MVLIFVIPEAYIYMLGGVRDFVSGIGDTVNQ